MAILDVPSPIVTFNSHFPLKTYPPIKSLGTTVLTAPTLWIRPPRSKTEPDSVLSHDVECLKWQAYLALRGLKGIKVRWDIAPEGTIDGSLPNLHVPITESLGSEKLQKSETTEDGDVLAARSIPSWVDMKLGIDSSADPLEGYKDQEARVESRAWVSLLEDVVHAALVRIS
jgi:metaxin